MMKHGVTLFALVSLATAVESANKRKLPRGVYETRNGTYCARIGVDKKFYRLGTFKSLSEARKLFQDALTAKQCGNWAEWYTKHKNNKEA